MVIVFAVIGCLGGCALCLWVFAIVVLLVNSVVDLCCSCRMLWLLLFLFVLYL